MQGLFQQVRHRLVRHPRARRLRLLTLAGVVAAGAAPAWAIDFSWLGGIGNWDDPTGWSAPGVPGSEDRATITSGNVTLSAATEVGELTMAGTSILGGSSIRVRGDAVLNGGTHTSGGTSEFAGRTIFNPGLRVFSGGRTVNTSFETYWTGSAAPNDNTIRLNGTVLWTNSGLWIDGNGHDNRMLSDGIGTRTFTNLGSYRKLGAGHSIILPTFDNQGHVEVAVGRLSLAGGANHSGTFDIARGATLSFGSDRASSGTARFDGSQVTGNGTLMVDARPGIGTDVQITGTARHAGTLDLRAGQLEVLGHYTVAGLVQLDGEISGDGTLVVEGSHVMDAGHHIGNGVTQFLGDVTLGDGTRVFGANRTIETFGRVEWLDNVRDGTGGISDFRFQGQATWINRGNFEDRNVMDALISIGGGGGAQTFVNHGNYLKLDSGTSVIRPDFDNRGQVHVAAGRLSLVGGATHSGGFEIDEAATLSFGHLGDSLRTHELSLGQLAGNGRLLIDGTSGIGIGVRLTGNGSFAGLLEVRGGNLELTGEVISARFAQSAGTISLGDLQVTGEAVLTGGRQTGAASTVFQGPLLIAAPGGIAFASGRQVETAGDTRWTGNTAAGANAIDFNGSNVRLVNTGTWTDSNGFDSSIGTGSFGTGKLFINDGTYEKTGLSTTTVSTAFHNSGTLRVGAGGVFHVVHAEFLNSGVLAGGGTIRTAAGSALVSDGTVAPGASVGSLTVDGDLDLQPGNWLDIELTTPTAHDVLAVTADLTLGGTLNVVNLGYAPEVGDQFVIVTFAQRLEDSMFSDLTWTGFGSGVQFGLSYNLNDVTLGVLAVPEPGTWLLWLVGVAGIAAARPSRRAAELLA